MTNQNKGDEDQDLQRFAMAVEHGCYQAGKRLLIQVILWAILLAIVFGCLSALFLGASPR